MGREIIHDPFDVNWVPLSNAELSAVLCALWYLGGNPQAQSAIMGYSPVTGQNLMRTAGDLALEIQEFGNRPRTPDGNVATIERYVTGKHGDHAIDDCERDCE